MDNQAEHIRQASALRPDERSDFSLPHLTDFNLQLLATNIYNKQQYKITGVAVAQHRDNSYTYTVNFVTIETEPNVQSPTWYFDLFRVHRVNGYNLIDTKVLHFIEPELPALKPSWRIQLTYKRILV